MRTEQEMFDLFITFAKKDHRIRLMTLEGSRTNPSIPDDGWKDYDLSYFVTDMASFLQNDDWLVPFGKRLILQKPEAMKLYPAELGNWFSYLMLFEDGNKVDLTLIPLEETASYFEKSDGLVEVLLDKDQRITDPPTASDERYWIQAPTAKTYDDCCNEFWWLTTYVAKGLAREELLFAADHLNGILRPALLQMMAWEIGSREGFDFSLGKNYKFIQDYLPVEKWQKLLESFNMSGTSEMWHSLFTCCHLFRDYSQTVAQTFHYRYPAYDENITPYLMNIFPTNH